MARLNQLYLIYQCCFVYSFRQPENVLLFFRLCLQAKQIALKTLFKFYRNAPLMHIGPIAMIKRCQIQFALAMNATDSQRTHTCTSNSFDPCYDCYVPSNSINDAVFKENLPYVHLQNVDRSFLFEFFNSITLDCAHRSVSFVLTECSFAAIVCGDNTNFFVCSLHPPSLALPSTQTEN